PAHPTGLNVDSMLSRVTHRVETYRDDRGGVIATDTVYYGMRGPLRKVGGKWMSMRWTVLEAGTEPQAFMIAQRARSVEELQSAFGRSYKAPAQNLVSA